MIRQRALKAVLVLVGLLFSAGVYPLWIFFGREPALAMMLTVYVTLNFLIAGSARSVGESEPDRLRGMV